MDNKSTVNFFSTPENTSEKTYDFHPKLFEEYIGQEELKKKFKLYIQAACLRQEPLDHTLISGPPGLGKTTFAQIISHAMQVPIKICSGPTLERTGDVIALLTSISFRELFFIDEIHRLPAQIEEILYNAMEHFRVDIVIGQGPGARSVNLPIQPFTLIGATTKSGLLSAPLRSRFGITERLDFYQIKELAHIAQQSSSYLGLHLTENSALCIAHASRGTPRITKKIVRRIRDFAQIENISTIDEFITKQALHFMGIDQDGLGIIERIILTTIIEKFGGGPVGLETIASIVGEDSTTIEEVYEPFLLRTGLLERTARGRQIPSSALASLKKRLYE